MPTPTFDLAAAHRYFSAACFNACWELIEAPNRTPEQDDEMLERTLASLWHWRQRADIAPKNLSIGHWQVSRVYSLLGRGDDARRHAEASEWFSRESGVDVFCQAFAQEALARAALVSGDAAALQLHRAEAERLASLVEDARDRALIAADLRSLASV